MTTPSTGDARAEERVASLSMEIGRLHWADVRDYLKAAQFKGAKIEWIESSGFFERQFTIKGDVADLRAIKRDFDAWFVKANVQ